MKQLLRFKTFLLLAIFSLFAGTSMLAQSNLSATETSNVTLTAGTNGTACTVNGETGIKVGTSSKGGDMSVTIPAGTTHLHVHAAAWKGVTGLSLNISGATTTPSSISLTADEGVAGNSPFTLNGNASGFYFVIELSNITAETTLKFTTSTTKRFVIWGVNAETVASGLTDSDLAWASNTSTDLSFDLYNPSAQVLNYTTLSTGAVTIADNPYATFSINETDKTITVTPTAVTPSTQTQTITVNQAADNTYNAGSVTFTLTVVDNTPIPSHTATFSVNGTTSTQDFDEGAAIVFPANPSDIDGKQFVGWVTEAISGTTDVAPTFVTSATMGSSDVTYYAVFATVTGSQSNESMQINSETTGLPSSYGSANTFTEYTLNGVNFQIQQMYKNGQKLQWRAANNSNGTGTMYNSESLGKIQSVVLQYESGDNNKNFTLKVGSSANPTGGEAITPTVNGSVYTFDCSAYDYGFFVLTNGSGAGYLDYLEIYYTIGSATASAYCTTVAADPRAESNLAFSSATAEATIGQTFTAPTLSAANGFDLSLVEYESSNSDVAMVMDTETGELRLMSGGTAIITASFAGNNDFKPSSASYELTVTDNRTATTMSFPTPAVRLDVNDIATFTGQLPVVMAGETTVAYDVNVNLSDVYFETDPEFFSQEILSSLDGNSGELTLSGNLGTVTVKVTYRGSDIYKPCEGSYTITVEQVLSNIAAFKAVSDNTSATFNLTDAQVLYNHNNGNRLYVRDASGALLLFNSGLNYEANKMLNGKMTATKTTYREQVETTGTVDGTNITVSTAPAAAVPVDATVGDVTSDYTTYDADLVKFSGVSVSGTEMTDATSGTITVYQNTFGTNFTFETGKVYDVTGIVGKYNSTIQVYPISVDDVTPAGTVLSPTFDVAEGEVAAGTVVTISSEDGTVIVYTTDGEDPLTAASATTTQSNTATVTINNAMTIRAVATDQTNYSSEATASYTVRDASLVDATYNFTDADWVAGEGYGSGEEIASWAVGNVVIGGDKGTGSNAPTYYTSNGGNLRTYNGCRFAVASTDGTPITSIVMVCSSATYAKVSLPDGQPGNLVLDGATYTWTPAAGETPVIVTFTGTGTSRISTLTVTTKSDVTVEGSTTISSAEYSTLYTEQPFEVPTGMTAGIVTAAGAADANGLSKLTIEWNYPEGAIVPAATPLLIKGAAASYTYVCKGTVEAAPSGNLLHGSATATETTGAAGDKFYMLSMGSGANAGVLGFYWGAANGAAFQSKAGKCWLAFSASSGIRGFIIDWGDVTGISMLQTAIANGQAVYDLQGRRVQQAVKGVYIIGGKKVLVK